MVNNQWPFDDLWPTSKDNPHGPNNRPRRQAARITVEPSVAESAAITWLNRAPVSHAKTLPAAIRKMRGEPKWKICWELSGPQIRRLAEIHQKASKTGETPPLSK